MTSIPHSLQQRLRRYSVQKVLTILQELGHGNICVMTNGRWTPLKDWVHSDDVCWCLADQTGKVVFYGGPPTKRGLYIGTLYTLVLDRLNTYLCKNPLLNLFQLLGDLV